LPSSIHPSHFTTDYLIIGGGVAGLRAALSAVEAGEVLIITKDKGSESSSEYAQGGVAVVLSEEDEISFHFDDTVAAGAGLCNEESVKVLVEEGPRRILELMDWGALFDRDGVNLLFAREAAHSKSRILRAGGDSTGREMVRTLRDAVGRIPRITHRDYLHTIDLIVKDGRCRGALVLDERTGEVMAVFARAVILASGGAGQIYHRTTNPAVATGDGMAIAWRAGATLTDMEFVQFHPTSLFLPGAPSFLLTEAMRGEGAILKNIRGERFMPRYDERAELAPRDIVSRAILSEMVSTGSTHVFLDLTALEPGFIRERFPRIHTTCLRYGIDIARQPIPVSPSAHYIMGGVKTDLDGATDLPGLYAAGEVACTGVHGANRLASNSLLEGLVYGARCGEAARKERGPVDAYTPKLASPSDISRIEVAEGREAVRRAMWEKVGIIRCEISLMEARQTLDGLKPLFEGPFVDRPSLEAVNIATVGEIITEAALRRRGSVGAHYRSDAKERGEHWERHTLQKRP